MGRYLKDARWHAERIQNFYDYGGPVGHQQAEHHFHKLEDLVGRAGRSKNDKSDVAPILALLQPARAQMREMAQRRDEWEARTQRLPPQE